FAVLERHAEQPEPVADQAKAELARYILLQLLDLLVGELDDLPSLDVDQVVVVAEPRRLVARASVAEIVALEDASAFEQTHGAVDSGQRDARIARRRPAIDLFDVGMILCLGQNLSDGPALPRHEHALLGAETLQPAFRCGKFGHLAYALPPGLARAAPSSSARRQRARLKIAASAPCS